jgi:hypothetical protein
MLIAARASMGIGATMIMPATLAIIMTVFTDQAERQRALGIWAGTTGAGVALGPIVGGVLLAHFAWGSIFLINVPIAIAGIAAAIPLVPGSRNPDAGATDVGGALLSVAGLGLGLWAIIEAPQHGWTSGEVLAAGIASIVILGAFAVWEGRSSHPMLRLDFFRRRSFSVAIVGIGTMMFALMGTLFALTQFLQFQLGYSALSAGVHMLPAAGGIAVIAPLSSVAVRYVGTKLTAGTGLLLVGGGLLQISTVTIASTYAGQLPGTIMLGVGAGLVMPACVGSLLSALPAERAGIGSATNGTFVQVGGALGVAILGSLLATRYQSRLNAAPLVARLPAGVHRTIVGSLGAALGTSEHLGGFAGAALAAAARAAFVSGMDLGLRVAAIVAFASVVLVLAALPGRRAAETSPTRPGRRAGRATLDV